MSEQAIDGGALDLLVGGAMQAAHAAGLTMGQADALRAALYRTMADPARALTAATTRAEVAERKLFALVEAGERVTSSVVTYNEEGTAAYRALRAALSSARGTGGTTGALEAEVRGIRWAAEECGHAAAQHEGHPREAGIKFCEAMLGDAADDRERGTAGAGKGKP